MDRKVLEMERKIIEEWYCPCPPYPIFGKSKPNDLITISLGKTRIFTRANPIGEWLIDLTQFWFLYRIDYTKFKTFKIKIEHKVEIDLSVGTYDYG